MEMKDIKAWAEREYKEIFAKLENSLATWTEAEKAEFHKNGKAEIEEYGWYYTASDYNSYIIVLKALLREEP